MLPSEADVEVHDIVQQAQTRNESLHVTGALLWTEERFVQFIEGPAGGISTLQSSILRDARHQSIVTIKYQDSNERLFPGWALAYAGPSQVVAKAVEQAISISRKDITAGAEMLIELLKHFSPSCVLAESRAW